MPLRSEGIKALYPKGEEKKSQLFKHFTDQEDNELTHTYVLPERVERKCSTISDLKLSISYMCDGSMSIFRKRCYE